MIKHVFIWLFIGGTLSAEAQWPILTPSGVNYDIERKQDSIRDIKVHLLAWPLRIHDTASQKHKFLIIPQGQLYSGLDYNSALQGRNTAAGGFAATGSFGKFNWYADALGGFFGQSSYRDSLIYKRGVVPGIGRVLNNDIAPLAWQGNGYLHYNPGKIFIVEAGKGTHFLGEGHRSLLLSDVAASYPYLRLTTKVWNVQYENLYTIQKHRRLDGTFRNKHTTSHWISWNITKRLNVSIFETIVFQATDTLLNRGFDVNYLNPFIFYRPVEYYVGSPDNALMGLNTSYHFKVGAVLYSQFVIDEFYLKRLRNTPGWWANKWGFQVGAKFYEAFGIKGLFLQTEYNVARPFIYGHGSPVQNYAHEQQPLAHPLGANFREWVNRATWHKDEWTLNYQFNLATKGTDTAEINFGGNIFKTYTNRYSENHNKIGQGVSNLLIYNDISVCRWIKKDWFLQAHAGYTFYLRRDLFAHYPTHYVYVGISSALRRQNRDY
ncbi:MAG: hypothetical protein ACK4K0_07505 [Flavobacteriales bacterium]